MTVRARDDRTQHFRKTKDTDTVLKNTYHDMIQTCFALYHVPCQSQGAMLSAYPLVVSVITDLNTVHYHHG